MGTTSIKATTARGPGVTTSFGTPGAQVRTYGNPIPYVMPWAAGIALLILAIPVRVVLAHDSYAWFWSVMVFAAYGAMTLGAWRASRARGRLTNVLVTAGMGGASGWTWWVAGVPNITWRHWTLYLFLMIPICVISMFLSALKGPSDAGGMFGDLRGMVDKVRNVNEQRVIDGGVVRARMEMEAGYTAKQLAQDTGVIASMMDVPETAVTITTRPTESARVGDVSIEPNDALVNPTPYPGPSHHRGSMLDPIVVGVRRGGRPLQYWLTGDAEQGRNASLVQVTGMSGAGKTELIRYSILEILSRTESEYWYLNPRKADQEPDWVRRGAARFANDVRGTVAALRELEKEMPARAKHLGARELDQWAPGCGLAHRTVIVDEAAAVAADVERLLTNLSETLRSLGVILIMGFQRATGDRFPTSARSNFGTHFCLGVKDEVDASMGLPDEVLESGAKPWVWGNRYPGYVYESAPGVPEDEWCSPARTYKPNKALMERWADHLIAQRQRPGGLAAPSPTPRPAPPAADDEALSTQEMLDEADGVVVLRDDALGDDVELADDDLSQLDDEDALDEALADVLAGALDDEALDGEEIEVDDELPRPRVPADMQAEMAATTGSEPLGDDGDEGGSEVIALAPRMAPKEAQRFLASYLIKLGEQGKRRFKVEDIGDDVLIATGMRASWLYKWLGNYCEGEGAILRRLDDDGYYQIIA